MSKGEPDTGGVVSAGSERRVQTKKRLPAAKKPRAPRVEKRNMPTEAAVVPSPAPVPASLPPSRRRFWEKPLAQLLAWAAFNALFTTAAVALCELWRNGPSFVPASCLSFVLVSWLVVLLPLFLLAADRFWSAARCAVGGALAGGLMIFLWASGHPEVGDRQMLILLAAVMGGLTCLFGAKLRYRLRQELQGKRRKRPLELVIN